MISREALTTTEHFAYERASDHTARGFRATPLCHSKRLVDGCVVDMMTLSGLNHTHVLKSL